MNKAFFTLKSFLPIFCLFLSLDSRGQSSLVSSVMEMKKNLTPEDSLLKPKIDAAIKKFNKKLIASPELRIGHQSLYQNGTDSSAWQGILNLGFKFNTLGLPIDFNLSYQTLPRFGSLDYRQQLFSFKYQDQFSKIRSGSYMNRLGQATVKKQLQEFKYQTKLELDKLIKEEAKSSSAFNLDPSSIKQLIVLPDVQLRPQIDHLVDQMKKRTIAKLPWGNNLEKRKDSITVQAEQYKTEMLQKIQKIKAGFSKIGVKDNYQKDFMAYVNNQINDEQLLDLLVNSELEQSSVKQGFNFWKSHIDDFHLGQFSQKLPFNQLNREQFLNGFQVSLKTSRAPVSIGFVKENSLGGFNEAEFDQSSYSGDKYIGFFKTVVQNSSNSKGTLSIAGTSTAYSDDFQSSAGPSQSVYALGFEQTLRLPKAGELRFELNKSFSKYNDATITDFKGQFINDHTFGQLFSNDFSQSFSGGITHQIDLSESGLTTNAYLSYSGMEFQNPGNSAFNQPRLRWGAKVKKSFFDRKLSLSAKADRRSSSFGNSNGWSNQLIDLESRVKLNRKTTLTFKYQSNATENRATSSINTISLNSGTQKYQISGYTGFKLMKLRLNTQFNMALQNISLPAMQALSRNVMLTLFNTVSVGKQSFTASLFMNREQNIVPLIGDMFNADLAWQYVLAKEWALSTGVTYLDNQQMARQVGGKQSLQYSGIKNMDMNLFLDLRKNLIAPSSPILAGTARGEISMTYYLRKK